MNPGVKSSILTLVLVISLSETDYILTSVFIRKTSCYFTQQCSGVYRILLMQRGLSSTMRIVMFIQWMSTNYSLHLRY